MKILKRILIIAAVIIAILLIIPLFTAKEYSVKREITINKPRQQVFDYVRILNNQKHYNVWVMEDTNSRSQKTGTDGTAGYITTWDSENENVGKGEQEIKTIKEGEKIDVEIRFIKPFVGKAHSVTTTESISENQTRVTCDFNSRMKYPMNIMLVFLNMDKNLGTPLAESLANLKKELEK